jgi:ketosteroid isomerase-like protein
MSSTREIIETVYDAWRRGDADTFFGLLDERVEHTIHIPRELHPEGGTTLGKAATAKRLATIAAVYEILAFDNGPILVDGEEASARVRFHYRHRDTGETLDTMGGQFWSLADGRIVRIEEYFDIDEIGAFSRRCGLCA